MTAPDPLTPEELAAAYRLRDKTPDDRFHDLAMAERDRAYRVAFLAGLDAVDSLATNQASRRKTPKSMRQDVRNAIGQMMQNAGNATCSGVDKYGRTQQPLISYACFLDLKATAIARCDEVLARLEKP